MKIKTLDIAAKEWFDRVNGNSYFSARVTVNFGTKTEKTFCVPMQYGYGDQYITESREILIKEKVIKNYPKYYPLWRYCRENNIILRTVKYEKCTQREVKDFEEC